MDHAVQPAPAERRIHYERRRPEDTVLYQVVQEHLETFFAQVELETGAGLPEFVKAEFEAFLECGILAHGFAAYAAATVAMRSSSRSHVRSVPSVRAVGRGAWQKPRHT